MHKVVKQSVAMLVLVFSSATALAQDLILESSTPSIAVTTDDIDRYILENLPPEAGAKAAVLKRPGIFREMAEKLYTIRSIAAEAEQRPGFDETQARWAAQIAYERKLVQQYRVHYIQDSFKDVDWDSMARDAYNAEIDSYRSEETISASHILIKTGERSDEEALKLAQELHQRVVKGEDFNELAKAYSEDPSVKRNNGNLGYFQAGKMVPEFDKAAFALAGPEEISEPVKSGFGYHVIRLNDRKPAGPIPFDKVKNQIIKELQISLGNQIWQDKIIGLRSTLKLDQAQLDSLEKKYAQPGIGK